MIENLIGWFGGSTSTVAFAILSGVAGFLAKGFYDLRLARRKDKLERINAQLRQLYGPLYALNQSGKLAWTAFRTRVRPGVSFFGSQPPPSDEDLRAWRHWMLTVFQPINEEMLVLITRNADLLIEDDLPEALQFFCAHVAAYKVVFERWRDGDFSEHTSVRNYPTDEMARYLADAFRHLKSEQRRLLGATKSSTTQIATRH